MVITQHGRKRMMERGIYLADIVNAIETGEIIEHYPDDFPFPSALILGTTKNFRQLHVVASLNDNLIYLITAYYPDEDNWETDMKTRKDG